MRVPAPTPPDPDRPLYRDGEEALAAAQDLAANPELFLAALRERHARVSAPPIPVPVKPIDP